MTTPILRPDATVQIAGDTLTPEDGSVTLAALDVPYAQAAVTIPLQDPALVERIDPRTMLRAVITAGDEQTGESRTFDLLVRERIADHKARTLRLDLASDEALLLMYAQLTEDRGARAYETSLRAVCNYVLGKIGASLATGGPDADVTAYWEVTNFVTNPECVFTDNGWVAEAPVGTITGNRQNMSTPVPGTGTTGTYQVASSGGATDWVQARLAPIKISPGDALTWSAFYYSSAANRTVRAGVDWYNDAGIRIGSAFGTTITADAATWYRPVLITRAPAAAVTYRPFIRVTNGLAAGNWIRITGAFATNTDELVPYFSGSWEPDDGYTYAWGDTWHESPSIRTPVVERLPELFVWRPGVSAWAFLEPLVSAAGLRLFCDEQRVWRLVDPATYSISGRISVAGWNATQGEDTITITDPELWCTGVVVRYSWTDVNDIERSATDSAGVAGSVYVLDLNRAYPGPGIAAAILNSRTGRGRQQEVTALASWSAQPAMEAGITLPAADEQIGQITTVEWGLTQGLMRLETRALTATAPGTIAALTGTIAALTGTIANL